MKRILAIDTCGSLGSVDLFDLATGDVLGQATLPGRETQELLLPAIQSVLSEAACAATELYALAVATGPGSFTGVRIGMAAVKGLAEATGVPVVALSRLTGLASAYPERDEGDVHAWLDAGRGDVYSAVVSPGTQDLPGREALIHGTTAREQVKAGDTVVVLEPALQEARSATDFHPVLITSEEYRRSLRTLAQKSIHAGEFADTALLDANYLRVPDAELALKSRTAVIPFASPAVSPPAS